MWDTVQTTTSNNIIKCVIKHYDAVITHQSASPVCIMLLMYIITRHWNVHWVHLIPHDANVKATHCKCVVHDLQLSYIHAIVSYLQHNILIPYNWKYPPHREHTDVDRGCLVYMQCLLMAFGLVYPGGDIFGKESSSMILMKRFQQSLEPMFPRVIHGLVGW